MSDFYKIYASMKDLDDLRVEIQGDLDIVAALVGGEEPEPDGTEVAE